MSTTVAEIMHDGVEWVPPDAKLSQVARIMKEKDIGAVPVGDNDRLVGMVTDRDLAVRALANGRDPGELTARDVMSEPIVYCHADERIEDAIRLMESRQIRRLPVINENKRMVGILSIGDISQCGHRDLTAEVMSAVSDHHG
ncbi:inosine-5-monophosphate dehydrogenase [Sphingobium jiangsuense]|uniref:CBS domain-containing protein n=1 Tax=Sphingobium jiangsuense TaxID=870476 RepID=A0A7W6BN27_9SPHN|nr:CBS domain-containing protein [Sphingobium jiangsuense]MBB3925628.1 CBS domain-containing protein [Sphingobium jiangsuense]GLT01637.1 inosine-5-monophosphate dehydrogenase [Sphingobium jiangsuense]